MPQVAGDVEIDLQPGGWRAGHDQKSALKIVILLVIWNGTPASKPERAGPETVLAWRTCWMRNPSANWRRTLKGMNPDCRKPCAANAVRRCANFATVQLGALFTSPPRVRLPNKAAAILARAKSCGCGNRRYGRNLFRALELQAQCLADAGRGGNKTPAGQVIPRTAAAAERALLGIQQSPPRRN